MTVKQAAAITGGAIVAGWITGVATLFGMLLYGPDLPDRFDVNP